VELRRATIADADALAAHVAEGFGTYLEWAPPGWTPPPIDAASMRRLRARLERPDVWVVIALDGAETAGHAGLSSVTGEEPAPAPPGSIYLWQMFVRPSRHGTGAARALMAAAVAEAGRRDCSGMLLWTPRGARRARAFYEREGWRATGRSHERSPSGLPTVEYSRVL
jgi:GNAT superfamily N-acetyltransferase